MADEIFSLYNFSLKSADRLIFDDVSLSVKKGEIHAIMSGRAYDLSNFTRLFAGDFDIKKKFVFFNGNKILYSAFKNYSYSVLTRPCLKNKSCTKGQDMSN